METLAKVKPSAATPEELLGPLNDVERKFAPSKLYVAGDVGILRAAPRAAIIGTRKASPGALQAAGDLAKALAKNGVVIVSGLAEGIDTAAHKAAIEAGGRTIAVLGTPLDRVYPARNFELQQLIMREHLAMTQFPTGHPVQRRNFPLRNRTMALIANASIIVEAGNTSGSLHQGWEALRLGRPLFIWKSLAEDASLTWTREMRRYGAMVLSDPGEVIEVLPAPNAVIHVNALP
ncbi:MAG: DNA-processing protein DprA [Halobacteria archaeon]